MICVQIGKPQKVVPGQDEDEANPSYTPLGEESDSDSEDAAGEPKSAFDAAEDEKLIAEAKKRHLKKKGVNPKAGKGRKSDSNAMEVE